MAADKKSDIPDNPDAPDPHENTNELDDLVVRVANESNVLDGGVLLLAELSDHITATGGDVEKMRRLANSLNVHQHHLATALTVKNVEEMPASEVPESDLVPTDVRDRIESGEGRVETAEARDRNEKAVNDGGKPKK